MLWVLENKVMRALQRERETKQETGEYDIGLGVTKATFRRVVETQHFKMYRGH
jgi:hypothetical protein